MNTPYGNSAPLYEKSVVDYAGLEQKEVHIWGGGMSGMTVALELSHPLARKKAKAHGIHLNITLHEKDNELGGKLIEKSSTTELSTHALRVFTGQYKECLRIWSEIPTEEGDLVDRMSAFDSAYFTTQSGKVRMVSRKHSDQWKSKVQLFRTARMYGVPLSDFPKIIKLLRHYKNTPVPDREPLKEVRAEDYLIQFGISKAGMCFLTNYAGVVVAATKDTSASSALDLMSKMFVGEELSSIAQSRPNISNAATFTVDGPVGQRLIPPMEQELRRRGVCVRCNEALSSLSFDLQSDRKVVAHVLGQSKIEADIHVLALHNTVTHRLLQPIAGVSPLQNEGSAGIVIPLSRIPKPFSERSFRSATVALDSPWALAASLMLPHSQGGLYHDDVDFPEGHIALLQIVASHFDGKSSNGKTVWESTPEEVVTEMLKQLDVEENCIPEMVAKAVFSRYLRYISGAERPSDLQNGDLVGPLNSEGCSWVLENAIYNPKPNSPTRAISFAHIDNLFLCGEGCSNSFPGFQVPTLEQVAGIAVEVSKQVLSQLCAVPSSIHCQNS